MLSLVWGAMQLLFDIAVVIIKILIAIGDGVLFALRILIWPIRKIFLLIETLRSKRKRVPKSKVIFTQKVYRPKFRIAFRLPTIPPFLKSIKKLFPGRHQKRYSTKIIIKKVYVRKRVIVFSIPVMFKFKYFIIGWLFSLLFIFLPILFFIFLEELPHPKSMSLGQIPQTTKIYDRHGVLLYQIFAAQNRTIVSLSDIPKNLQDATIAIEDKDFYKHPGFDIVAITRSAIENFSGNGLQGGSTITQQLIKSALLTPEPTIERKIKEVILAFWAERIYTKEEILQLYFNHIPYGGTAWGVQAASEVYFGKNVKDLTLAQSAFLAGIPKAPTIYSPFGTTPNLWKKRQKEVLDRMVKLGLITRAQEQEASEETLNFREPQTPIHAPHFVMYVKDWLEKTYGLPMVERGGLIVRTSLDLRLQAMAQRVVADEVANNAALAISNGASLITSPQNGDILAMVGSSDFNDQVGGNVNVTTSLRQPGSSIKIVTYTAALQNGFTATSILDDSPISFPGASGPYAPVNYDGRFHGRLPLRIAFASSLNIPAVKTLNQIGIPEMVDQAKKMGIKSWGGAENYGLSITLGSAEVTMTDMATVFGTIANGGVRVDLNPILEVSDYKGNVWEKKKEIIGKRVVDEGIAFIISDILADNNARAMEFGPSSPLYIPGKTVSVKTGTSDNKRDNWTIGFTPSYVVAAWVGNNDNSPMSQNLASGITGAAPIWNRIMVNLIQGSTTAKMPKPVSVVEKKCYGRIEYFITGTEKNINCPALPLATPTPTPQQ